MTIENPGQDSWRGFKDRPLRRRIKEGCALLIVAPIAVGISIGLKGKDRVVNNLIKTGESLASIARVIRERFK